MVPVGAVLEAAVEPFVNKTNVRAIREYLPAVRAFATFVENKVSVIIIVPLAWLFGFGFEEDKHGVKSN